MWLPRKQQLIEPKLFLALGAGIIVILGVIGLTVVIERSGLVGLTHELERFVPQESIIFINLDLAALNQEARTLGENPQWLKIQLEFEKFFTNRLKLQPADMKRLSSILGPEISFFALPDGQGAALLIKTRSAKEFRTFLEKRLLAPARTEEIGGKTVTIQPSDFFSGWEIFGTSADQGAPSIYWTEVKRNVFIAASASEPIRRALEVRQKDRASLSDILKAYRQTPSQLSFWIKPASFRFREILPEPLRPRFNQDEKLPTQLYGQLSLAGGQLSGFLSDHPVGLLERVSAGDAENMISEAQALFPESYSLAWLGLNLQEIFSFAEQSTNQKRPALTTWSKFFSEYFRFDWARHILPLVDLNTDIVLGPDDGKTATSSFIVFLKPESERLAESLDNLEALLRNTVGVLVPRKVEKTLSDGSTVTELVPDPQALTVQPFLTDGMEESGLKKVTLQAKGIEFVYGQYRDRLLFSNAPALVKGIGSKIKPNQLPACASRIAGQRALYLSPHFFQTNNLGQYLTEACFADASQVSGVYLTFCFSL